MKLLLSIFAMLAFTLSAQAQYKDSLKTFRKLTKKYQKHSDFVFIPSGYFGMGMPDYNPPSPGAGGSYLMSRTVQVDSFFIQRYEVSNAQYLEFIKDVSDTNSQLGRKYLPDTMVWRMPLTFGEKYVDYYFRHPAYANYPVVGVSYSKAKAFAEWKTEQYNSREDREFKKVRFRLPKEEEWEYAAAIGNGSYGYLPWQEPNTIDEDGEPRANFTMISQVSIYRDTLRDPRYYQWKTEEPKTCVYWLSTGEQYVPTGSKMHENYIYDNDLLMPVKSYEPNGYGLYQMAGNVEEIVDAYYYRDPTGYYFSSDIIEFKYDKPWGVTKGGSWNDPGFYLQYPIRQFYEDEDSASSEIGFRLVMEVLEY